MNLIAISGKRRSGKTTLGNLLRDEYGYTPVSLAEPLKALAMEHFGLMLEQVDGCLKESPTQFVDHTANHYPRYFTPREILIRMGQFYRSIDKDYWIKKLFEQMQRAQSMKVFVVTDVRFKNEMEWMKKHQAIAVRLERDESLTGKNINDVSETDLDDYQDWNIKIPADENQDMTDLARIGDIINAHLLARNSY